MSNDRASLRNAGATTTWFVSERIRVEENVVEFYFTARVVAELGPVLIGAREADFSGGARPGGWNGQARPAANLPALYGLRQPQAACDL